jgi:hypothetical protein
MIRRRPLAYAEGEGKMVVELRRFSIRLINTRDQQ